MKDKILFCCPLPYVQSRCYPKSTNYPINILLGVCLFFAEKDEKTSLGGRNCCFLFARV